jgi:hypothetical protein
VAINSFDIAVPDLEAVLAFYDQIQVWRAATEDGTYAEITAPQDMPAVVVGIEEGPWALGGTSLSIRLNGADPKVVSFVGSPPFGLSRAIEQVNAVVPGLASELGGALMLSSPHVGTGASLEITGTAVSVLNILPTGKVNGKVHRIPLTRPTKLYRFRDFDGAASDYYKTRFYSSVSGAVSEFSPTRQAAPTFVLPEEDTSLAKIDLADGSGRPIIGRRVIFVPTSVKTVEVGGTLYGAMPGVDRISVTTDDRGHAEIALMRGMRFKVFVEGVQFQREITVPDEEEFNLLEAMTAAPDPFNIIQAPPMPIRNS